MKILRAAIKTWHTPKTNKSFFFKAGDKIALWTMSCQSEWLRSKSLQAINAGEGVEKREPSYTVGGNAN